MTQYKLQRQERTTPKSATKRPSLLQGTSTVSVSLGFTRSHDYSSVRVDASVSVTVEAGSEVEGLEHAKNLVNDFLASVEDDATDSLRRMTRG